MRQRLFPLIVMLTMAAAVSAQYQIEKSVVSSGGGEAGGGAYTATFTIGQPVAGGPLIGSPSRAYTGFWAPSRMPLTAAGVSLSGRIVDHSGRGIARVLLTLTDIRGTNRIRVTNTFGYYKFANVPSGESYVLSVAARRYRFESPTQLISVMDGLTGLDFRASASRP